MKLYRVNMKNHYVSQNLDSSSNFNRSFSDFNMRRYNQNAETMQNNQNITFRPISNHSNKSKKKFSDCSY